MAAVHRYEGTVNQVMGDGIMALFGAPIAHEDHAIRACYAALAMQDAIRRYSEGVRRAHGCEVQIRVGLNAGRGDGARYRQRSPHGLLRRRPDHAFSGAHGTTGHTGEHPADRRDPPPGRGVSGGAGAGACPGQGPDGPGRGLRARGDECHPAAFAGHGRAGAHPVRGTADRARGLAAGAGAGQDRAWSGGGGGRGARGGEDATVLRVCPFPSDPGLARSRDHVHVVREGHNLSPCHRSAQRYFQVEEGDDPRRIREKVTGKLLTLDEALRPTLPAFLSLLEVRSRMRHGSISTLSSAVSTSWTR